MVLLSRLIRRWFLLFHWVAFAGLATELAKNPGFVSHSEAVPYPWLGVFEIWSILAIFTAILYAILRPVTFDNSWKRLAGAIAFVAFLLALCIVTFVTDMPGLYYVPGWYAITTLSLLLFFSFVRVATYLARRTGFFRR